MSPFNIEEDNKDVREAVHAAKYGDWNKVYNIIGKKNYLVNCIPEGRSWAMLHQAVYWNNKTAVNFLLKLKTCDALIKTKRCRDELVPPSSTAIAIANKMEGREEVKNLIQQNINYSRNARFSQHISYKLSRKDGKKVMDHLPLFVKEIAMYKDTLVGEKKHVKQHLIDILNQIFKNEHEQHHWDKIEGQLHQSLYGFDKDAADKIGEAASEEKFFDELIRLYTGNWVYNEVNKAIAREFNKDYNPSAEDLALGLYAMLLDVTITFWSKLGTTSGKTYRGVGNQYGEYKVGDEIMFTTMVSCSGLEGVARGFAGSDGTLFTIYNSADASTRPKYIRGYSDHQSEDEYVYAIGTEFRVKSNTMVGKLRLIELDLLVDCELCKKP
eukprot:gene20050-22017_t